MARWSSSASELVDLKPAAADDAARAQAELTWALRPGFVAGSPWPRALALSLFGLPTLVCLAWLAAWFGVLMALALSLLALPAGLWGWRQLMRHRSPGRRPPSRLSWHGPWPGQPARHERSKGAAGAVRTVSRLSRTPSDAPGFHLNGDVVWPRIRLQWGPHVCLQCTDRDWAWLTLGEQPVDRALRVLLRTQANAQPQASLQASPRAAGSHAGSSGEAMASCRSWTEAVARRRALAEAGHGAAHEDFPATTIMTYDTGTELEPRRPHG